MSDPFDFLNPIASTKIPAQKVPQHAPVGMMPPAPVAPTNHMGAPPAFNMNMGAPPAFNGNMNNMNMNNMNMNMNMHMNMGGIPPHGGMMMPGAFPGAPGMGLGMNQPNPYGQQPAQQPPMYDNIKKLLEKKPVVDNASMDFLEGLGSGVKVSSHPSMEPARAEPFGAPVANPFGAPQPQAELDFGILGGGAPASAAAQPASPASGSKSSALASRLAHGKRPTQEAARKNLGFNAGAFASTGNSAKISLKSVAGGPTSNGEPTVDDFVAGNAPLPPVDDMFAATPTSPPANPSSSSNDIFW